MVLVGKFRPEPHRTAVGIDLVIDGQQGARGDFLGLLAVKGIHRQARSRSELVKHRRQTVFGDSKDDRDGFELGDHGTSRWYRWRG